MNGKGEAEADSTKMRGPAYRVDKKAMSKCGRLVPLDTPDVGWQGECTWGAQSNWFECMSLPDGFIAIKYYSTWMCEMPSESDGFYFRDVTRK